MTDAKNLIAGEEMTPSERVAVVSPRNPRETVGVIPQSTSVDVDQAVEAAGSAFQSWKRLGAMERGQRLFQAAAILEQHVDELAQLAAREMGKPIGEARGEALRAVAILRYYAGQGAHPVGDVIPAANPKTLQYTTRDPLGVVGMITPWNFPLAIPMWKVAPALIYGNTVVVKPAELSSLTAYRMFSLIQGLFPKGVINVVIGQGAKAGAALVQHPRVQGLSFTGSSQVGHTIACSAAERGVKYQLEMGGKNAVIVADDANIEQAVELVVSGAMRSAGQKCTATSRVMVMTGVHQKFREALGERVAALSVGDPLDVSTYLGPLVSAVQQERVYRFIDHACQEGYPAITGGERLERAGYFVAPTIFDEVDPTAEIAQEEIFGPVVALIPVATLDEAIAVANSVRYGLSASVFTQNLATALKVVDELEVGMVRVNEETAGVEYQAPFGGMKASSSHSREQGLAAREFYTETKTVAIRAI